MKIAYVDANVRYLNSTRDELIEALNRSHEVECIGPGFSNGDSVQHLQDVLSDPTAVDVVVTTPHVALATAFIDWRAEEIAALYRRSFAYEFDESQFGCLVSMNSLLAAATVPTVLLLLEADYYNFGPFEIDAFKMVSDSIFGFGPECWSAKSDLPHLAEEAFAEKVTDFWSDYLSESGDSVFSLHHLVGDDEFCYTPLSERKHSWSVMGAGYASRQAAIACLRERGIKPVATSAKRKIIGGLKRIGALRGESNWSLDLVQGDFHRKLCGARYSYTCGSGLDMPIRKFFEIPAAGSVLVCRPFRGAQHLGFVAGEHYVESEPQDLWDVHCHLEANPDEAQRIAHAGQALVKRLHSVEARAEQLRQSLEAVIRGSGVGRWCDGRFQIKPFARNSELHHYV